MNRDTARWRVNACRRATAESTGTWSIKFSFRLGKLFRAAMNTMPSSVNGRLVSGMPMTLNIGAQPT